MTSVPSPMTTHVRRDLRELIRPRYEKTVYTVSVSVSMGTLYSLEKQLCVSSEQLLSVGWIKWLSITELLLDENLNMFYLLNINLK
jgi:hypothetical protein